MHESLSNFKKEWHGTYKAYLIGFIASLLLTGASFLLVSTKATYALVGLALAQAIVQLIFFLHVGQEAKPKWETLIFLFMVLILLIVALGTLWIMNDLNHRVMEMHHD